MVKNVLRDRYILGECAVLAIFVAGNAQHAAMIAKVP
jgi:hypothetical protein